MGLNWICRLFFNVWGLLSHTTYTITWVCVHIYNSETILKRSFTRRKTFTHNKKKYQRRPRCNSYRRRKWTQWYEIEPLTSLFAFYIALILLRKVWILLFSLQLWGNSRANVNLGVATGLGKGKRCSQTC